MDIVKIKWIDSRQTHGWNLDDEIDITPCSIMSCGFLVRETEDAYTVALSRGYNPTQWCGINTIPKCCVVKKDVLETLNDYH